MKVIWLRTSGKIIKPHIFVLHKRLVRRKNSKEDSIRYFEGALLFHGDIFVCHNLSSIDTNTI